jgi:hypothetical protein
MGMAMGTGMGFLLCWDTDGRIPCRRRQGSGSRVRRVLAAADEVSAYILNVGTRDVTVVDAALGKRRTVLPVGRGCAYMFRSPETSSICVVCQGHLAVLDSRKHQVWAKYEVTSGKVIDAFMDPATGSSSYSLRKR